MHHEQGETLCLALTAEHVDLVRRVANRLHRRLGATRDLDDLVSDGLEAIALAANSWKADGGMPLEKWLAMKARFGMIDGLRRENGRYEDARRHRRSMVSLDAPVDDAVPDVTLHDMVPDPAQDVVECVEARLALARLSELPAREREALIGTSVGEGVDAVAENLGISPSRVTELRQRGLARIEPDTGSMFAPVDTPDVTPAELQVIEAAAGGLTVEQTATLLGKSTETIKTQRRAAVRRFGAADITNAVFLAARAGLLDHLQTGLQGA